MAGINMKSPFGAAALWLLSLQGQLAASELLSSSETPPAVRQVAIIGAGAAGASAAYHLEQFAASAGVPVNISIFEKTDRIGGRTLTVNAFGDPAEPVELGASIFIELNHILFTAAREFGLPKSNSSDGKREITGIWDGSPGKFVFTFDGGSWLDWGKALWKYGLAPRKTHSLMEATINKFLKLYEKPFFPFRSLTQRVFELDLATATADTGEQFLDKNAISKAYAHDIIQTSTRVNYASNLARIHGLDTMVSMAPEGAMQIAGGNWQIFRAMVDRSGAAVFLNASIASIKLEESPSEASPSASPQPKYKIQTTDDKAPQSISFDSVVIATPWQFAGIEDADGVLQQSIDEIPYVTLHVTLFASPFLLSQSFFGVDMHASKMPNTILTTLGPDDTPTSGPGGVGSAGFFSISTILQVTNPKTGGPEYVYKIFSPEKVTAEFLGRLLGVPVPDTITGGEVVASGASETAVEPVSWYHPHVFHSYPKALPRVTFQDPIVGPGLYYTSGIESFISTMETSALMGKNVAQLVVDDFLSTPDDAVEELWLNMAGGQTAGQTAGQTVLGSDL